MNPRRTAKMCCVDNQASQASSIARDTMDEGSLVRLLFALMFVLSACAKTDRAKHSEVATAILQQRGTPDFIDASTSDYAAIRHTPSGMLCVMPTDGAFEFDLFPAAATNAGAQCSSTEGELVTGWVAVHFQEPTSLDAAFASAVQQLTSSLSAQPWLGRPSAADLASPEGLPHFRIHRVRANFDGEERYLRVSMAEMDGWYLQQIVSSPFATASASEAAAGEAWRSALSAFAEARREAGPPPAAAP